MVVSRHCSLCGRVEDRNTKIIEGAEARICRDCAETSIEAFDELVEMENVLDNRFLKPHEIKAKLDMYIVGQEDAKKILSVAVYNHYKRIESKSKVDIQKTNIMLVGPTGSGKTYLMQTLAKILDVPLLIADATTLTEAGYIGENVDTLLENLLKKANGDIKKAEKGIIFIDEIDKLSKKEVDGKRNLKEGVQQALLKLVEDSDVAINVSSGNVTKKKVTINTKHILFVVSGAFVGIESILKARLEPNEKTPIGFALTPSIPSKNVLKDNEKEITQQDIVEFGIIPELVGRIPVIATLKALTKEDLSNILVTPKDSITKQYQALFRMDGIKLTFHKDAIDYITEQALKKKIGARGLKGVIEKKMYDVMYELPQQENVKSFTVTKEILTQ